MSTPTPILNLTPAPATAQALAAQRITGILKQAEAALVLSYNQSIDALWSHPTLSPQQVCDALSTSAGSLFTLAAQTVAYLVAADSSATPKLKQPKNAFTINADGTVTVSANPYVA